MFQTTNQYQSWKFRLQKNVNVTFWMLLICWYGKLERHMNHWAGWSQAANMNGTLPQKEPTMDFESIETNSRKRNTPNTWVVSLYHDIFSGLTGHLVYKAIFLAHPSKCAGKEPPTRNTYIADLSNIQQTSRIPKNKTDFQQNMIKIQQISQQQTYVCQHLIRNIPAPASTSPGAQSPRPIPGAASGRRTVGPGEKWRIWVTIYHGKARKLYICTYHM